MRLRNKNSLLQQSGVSAVLLMALLMSGVGRVVAETTQSQPQRASTSDMNKEIKRYQLLIQKNPDSLVYYNNLAVLYARNGELESARKTLQQGLNAQQEVSTLYNNLNTIFLEMSREDYASALRLDIESRKVNLTKLETNATRPQSRPIKKADMQDSLLPPEKAEVADQELINNTILGWASAWSAQEVDLYLSFYSDSFVPPNSLSRKQWAEMRKKRLTRPKWVSIKISDLSLSPVSQQRARVVFKQDYRSSNYSDQSRKELVLEQTDNGWKIVKESTQ